MIAIGLLSPDRALMSTSYLIAATARAADAAPRPSRALPLVDETAAAAAARGMRALATFSYRGVDITSRELPDAESNLLFGTVCWPAAETLARMFIDQARGGAKIWTSEASMQLGVPLELLLSKRFGGIKVGPPPFPSGLDRLGLASVVPDVSSNKLSVLEVGAGVGLTGLACHALGADVLLTDGEERLVKHAAACHSKLAEETGRLKFATLDWHATNGDATGAFDLVIGVEVLNPACEGEIHVPRLIGQKLSRRTGSRAMLLSEVRRLETCQTAVKALEEAGLAVACYRVGNGREAFEVGRELEGVLEVGATLLIVAAWPWAPVS